MARSRKGDLIVLIGIAMSRRGQGLPTKAQMAKMFRMTIDDLVVIWGRVNDAGADGLGHLNFLITWANLGVA